MPQARVDTIVTGGLVVTGNSAIETSLAILDGKIAAIGPADLLPQADRTIDASGQYVLPGLIDCHCHFRGWEDYALATRMAASAGLTTIIPFGITNVAQHESLADAVKRHQDEIAKVAVCDAAFHFQLGADPKIFDGIQKAAELGVRSFKMFMSYRTRRPPVMVDDEFILDAMERIAAVDGVTQLHCENGHAIDYNERKLIAAGKVKPTDFPGSAPEWVEAEAVGRAIELGAAADCPVYIVHLSTRPGLEHIRRAQAEGKTVWTETCPQYMLLAAEDMEKWGPLLKIGPPLRARDSGNHEALWQGLIDGSISCVGSDHSPHPREIKERGWQNVFYQADGSPVPFGSPSIETLAQLNYSKGVAERGLPLQWLARVMSENPARIFGLYPRKGTIQIGSDADLTIIDPNAETEVSAQKLLGKAGYTAYEGWKVRGKATMTLLRGRVLMEGGQVVPPPGYGRFLESAPPIPPV